MLRRLAPIVFVLLWSTGFIGARLGAPFAEPFTFLTIRFALVVALLFAICLAFNMRWPTATEARHAFVVGVLLHGVYLGCVFWVIDRGMPASVSALIISLQPILTAVFAMPLLGERIDTRHWLGLGLGLGGVALVLSSSLGGTAAGITAATLFGGVLSLLGITAGTIYQRRFACGTDLWTGAVFQYLGALCITGPAALLSEKGNIVWSGQLIFALIWLIFVLSIGAIMLLMVLIRENAVSRVASLFYLVPPVVALQAWFLFGSRLAPIQLVGMLAVVVAIVLVGMARPNQAAGARAG